MLSHKEIKNLIKLDNSYAIGALMRLYSLQTDAEKDSKSTIHQNDVGFNAIDSMLLTSIAKFYIRTKHISTKQLNLIKPKLYKYTKQLMEMGFDPIEIKSTKKHPNIKEKHKRTKMLKQVYMIDRDTVKYSFTFNQELVNLMHDLAGSRWKKKEKHWTAGLTVTNIEKTISAGFELDADLKEWYDNQTAGITDHIEIPGMKIKPYPFQYQGISYIDSHDGRALIGDDMGLGKMSALDTPILTENGWIKMGDIHINDFVIGKNGHPTKVTGVYPQGVLSSYKIMFSDGTFTNCGAEHLWAVKDTNRRYRKQDWTVKSAQELMDSGLQYPNGANKYNIPIVEPVHFPKKDLPIHPYIMGVLLAEGALTNSTAYSNPDMDSDISDKVSSLLPKEYKVSLYAKTNETICSRYGISYLPKHNSNPMKDTIHNLGLNVTSPNRFIPEIYQFGSVEQRLELLHGLMDGDGSAENNCIHYHTKSETLAQDVVTLVRSLGGISYYHEYDRTHDDKGIDYCVNVKINICPFSCKRKSAEWKPAVKNKPGKFIESITYIGEIEQQCIRIEAEDHLYVCEDFICTHNTLQAIAWLQLHTEIRPAVIICPASVKLNWLKEFIKCTHLEKEIDILYGRTPKPIKKSKKIYIINYDILSKGIKVKDKGGKTKTELDPESWVFYLIKKGVRVMICDECFVAGSMVNTPTGSVPIETIKEGDTVYNVTGTGIVQKTKNKLVKIICRIELSNGKIFKCSVHHPFFTIDGWVLAKDLTVNTVLLKREDIAGILNEKIPTMWSKIYPEVFDKTKILQNILFSEMENVSARYKGKDIQQKSTRQDKERINKNTQEKSEVGRRIIQKNDRKQSGYITRSKKENARSKENTVLETIRVVGIKIQKQGDSGQSATSIEKDFRVYNIEVSNHPSYFVENILVHNSHYLKNVKALRTKAALKLAKVTENVVCLTGTPIENRPMEIFSSCRMIKPSLFPSFKRFADKYCNPTYNGYGWNYNGASNTIELNQILTKEFMIRRKKEDVLLDMPKKTRTIIPMEITNRDKYNKAQDDLIEYLQEIDPDKASKAKQAEVLVKIETLKQIAVQGKLKECMNWVENFLEQDEKLILFTTHKKVNAALMDRFGDIAVKIDGSVPVKKRLGIIEQFMEDDNIRLFVGNIQAAGTGIDGLQYASSNCAFLEHPWTPGKLIQAEDRLLRMGQTKPVNCWNLVADETIEVQIIELLEKKSKIVGQVLDGIESENSGVFSELLMKLAV